MLRPTDIEKLKGKNSRYAVVVGVAKRAGKSLRRQKRAARS